MHKYIITIGEEHIRDAQVHCPEENENENENEDSWDSDNWYDLCAPAFIGVFDAVCESDAVKQAANKYRYPENILSCCQIK